MAIPPTEPKETYTYDEAMHLAAREAMKSRLSFIEERVLEQYQATTKLMEKFDAAVESIKSSLSGSAERIEQSRIELRKEIHEEFATQEEIIKLERKLVAVGASIAVAIIIGTAVIHGIFAYKVLT